LAANEANAVVQMSVHISVYSALPEPTRSALSVIWQLMIMVHHIRLNFNSPGVLQQCCMPVSAKQRVADNNVRDAPPCVIITGFEDGCDVGVKRESDVNDNAK